VGFLFHVLVFDTRGCGLFSFECQEARMWQMCISCQNFMISQAICNSKFDWVAFNAFWVYESTKVPVVRSSVRIGNLCAVDVHMTGSYIVQSRAFERLHHVSGRLGIFDAKDDVHALTWNGSSSDPPSRAEEDIWALISSCWLLSWSW